MITPKSKKREIRELQRLLLALELLTFTERSKGGVWGRETQDAVVAAYRQLGWDHADRDRWISAPALAALCAINAAALAGGAGTHAGGAGTHAGGAGTHAGGAGTHAG